MRALRIILIITVVLGGLFVAADRLAVGFAEDKAADRLRTSEGLAQTPDVSIKGFPFLTQVMSGEFDEVRIGIDGLEASNEGEKVRIEELKATMHDVAFSNNYSSATASRATGSARISYAELLKAAEVEPVQVMPGVTAKVTGLSDGGDGKIKVEIEVTGTMPGTGQKFTTPAEVLSSVIVDGGNTVKVRADTMPRLTALPIADAKLREITDFEQKVDGLPSGIGLEKVEAVADGVAISVTGSQVRLAG
ncbi:LmeA family phospholipid-binding protein [Streptomyces apocyni]|uniref:LmeA family phospholipid-binding protein n=1 Tax=Streptomyces apocyni TaxID=2654677 RepID=UPI0012EA9021|nr:DUF2993 domain-containing protein [Streptomyces apocyni]